MPQRLINRFIKNSDNYRDAAVRRDYGVFAEIFGMLSHLAIFLVKMICGLVIGSLAVRADALTNLAAIIAAAFRLFDLTTEEKASEKVRSQGIRRAKYILAFIAAFLIFEQAFSFFMRSFARLTRVPTMTPSIVTAVLLALTIVLRLYLRSFFTYVGRKTANSTLVDEARTAHAANIVTALVTASVLVHALFKFNPDYFVALIAAVMAMKDGILIAVRAVIPSVEETPDPATIRSVRERVRSYSGVVGIGKTKVRFFGSGRHVIAMRVNVPKESEPQEMIAALKTIEETVGGEFGLTLVLHAAPVETMDKEALLARTRLEKEIEKIDERLSFDHFHMVYGKDFNNLIFDLYIPEEYDTERIRSLSNTLREEMRKLNSRYSCVISISQEH